MGLTLLNARSSCCYCLLPKSYFQTKPQVFIKAALFLSCLATDIKVGLDSWVETDNEKEVNSEQDALNDLLEVLKSENLKISMEV